MRTFILFISLITILTLSFSCQSEPKPEIVDIPSKEIEEPKKEKIKIIREPIEIFPSTEKDYPEDLLALGFPIHPKVAIHNVGSTRIMEEGLLMQLNTYETEEDIASYYRKEMIDLGWTESKLNVFKGANTALKFDKDGLTCKLIIIDEADQNYRKMAVNVTKMLDLSKFQ